MLAGVLGVVLSLLSIPESRLDSAALRYADYCALCSPEKLFVHIDRTYYAAGDTLWMRGYLSNASPLSVLPVSSFIYAELLDSDGGAVKRVKIKKDSLEVFKGFLDFPDDLKGGDYTFRAYSLWQMNTGAQYMFNQRIRIYGRGSVLQTGKSGTPSPSESRFPVSSDGLDGSEPVYDVPSGLRIDFYPEGGRYFTADVQSIAFKATDSLGRSVERLEARLIEKRAKMEEGFRQGGEEEVTRVKAMHDGMGQIIFFPREGFSYSLRVGDMDFPLPEPSRQGVSLLLRRSAENFVLTVCGPGAAGIGECRIYIADREDLMPVTDLIPDGKKHIFLIPEERFRPGISKIILTDKTGRILSERAVYVFDRPQFQPCLKVSPRSLRLYKRGRIAIDVDLKDSEGKPLDGAFSVSVVRAAFADRLQDDNIVSYLRLSSEIRGNINNPQHYFDPSVPPAVRQRDMDLLMLVQGWSYYDLPSIFNPQTKSFSISRLKEYWQNVRFHVKRAIGQKAPRKFKLSILIPKLKITHLVEVDEGSRFTIDSLDFQEGTEFLINAGRSLPALAYIPTWDGDVFAPAFRYKPAPGSFGSVDAIGRDDIAMAGVSVGWADTLNAAVVSAGAFGDEPEDSFFGQSVSAADLKMYQNRTLIEFLNIRAPQFTYDGQNMNNRRSPVPRLTMTATDFQRDGMEQTEILTEESDPEGGDVKLIVDGMEQTWWGYDMLRIAEISSIVITTGADPVYNAPGGSVSIRLRTGADLSAYMDRDPSLLYFIPLGYQKPSRFYSPRYDRGARSSSFDARNTIFWDPDIRVRGGKAFLEFCNTDQMDYPYVVSISGLTEEGIPFFSRQIIEYK